MVSKEYGTAEMKGVLGRSNYEMVSTKKKQQCESTKLAIVAEGKDLGTTVSICADPQCRIHGDKHSYYATTPEEKKKRKEAAAKERAKAEAETKKETRRYWRRLKISNCQWLKERLKYYLNLR